ncbi:uncharacterized protein LOC131667815 [Phymastichus coffea]|uniref:uncharacterized protein LOC131667815 n=1 Tax=Phymastichus coffea TaxID=108790 RepID=UPI00273B6DE8|nr:uncharacterized protein LOC131667815 [Phymastichus coffea]
MLVKEKEIVLEGLIFNQNNNFFHDINEYITQQFIETNPSQNYSNSQNLDSYGCKSQLYNKIKSEDNHNFVNNKNAMFIKEDPVNMECGDDILYTYGNSYYNEKVVTKTNLIEMECGDDILFTNGSNYDEHAGTTLVGSDELECGDDILFTNGTNYYYSDENSVEGNLGFSYCYENPQTNVLKDEIKQKNYIKNARTPIIDTFEKQEDDFHYGNKCGFINQELYVSSQPSRLLNENYNLKCETCDRPFKNLSLLKKHQLESCSLKYFYTCIFCSSTSWYSSTLKNHIEVVHSTELDKENIDDIMEIIKRSKQVENACHRGTKKTVKIGAQTKKKKIYINYNEIKQLLNICCFECNKHPQYVRGKTEPYCKQCHEEYTFQCRKCSRFYFKYTSALLHVKRNCKKKISNTTFITNNQTEQGQEKSSNTLQNKSDSIKYFKTFCATCNKSKQKDCVTKTICWNCNKTSIKYQCDVCKKLFKVRIMAKRHSQTCGRQWQKLTSSSLPTNALLDHNYYRKSKIKSQSRDNRLPNKYSNHN